MYTIRLWRPRPASHAGAMRPRATIGGRSRATDPCAGGDTDQHDAEPWKQRHVILRRRLVRHHADPVEPRRVEHWQLYRHPGCYDCDAERKRSARPANERPGEHRRHRDAVQDAEG